MFCDRIWLNARLATLRFDRTGLGEMPDGGRRLPRQAHRLRRPRRRCSRRHRSVAAHRLRGRWITPGLIDCHTHLIHAGDRSHEFELRLQGANYQEIARAGGGILSTMRATRAATEEELVDSALRAARRPDRRRGNHRRGEVRLWPGPR